MLILGLVGLKGSGKGTVASILADRHGGKAYRFSTVLRDILERLDLSQSREHLIHLSETLRREFGENILERALAKDIRLGGADIVILDGIRRVEELAALRSLGNFHLIAIQAPFEIRYQRSANRGENAGENGMTEEAFRRTENASTEITIADVEKQAERIIQNTGTYEELVQKVNDLITELRRQP